MAYASAVGDDPYGRSCAGSGTARASTTPALPPTPAPSPRSTSSLTTSAATSSTSSAAARRRAGSAGGPAARRIEGAKVLHLSGISLAISPRPATPATPRSIRAERRVQVSFDTNLRLKLWPIDRARAVMSDVMRLADICLPSLDDVRAITGIADPDALVDHCLAAGAKTVALKLGENGAIVADAGQRHRIAPFACKPVDATGAGDTFGGAFVARLVAGDSLCRRRPLRRRRGGALDRGLRRRRADSARRRRPRFARPRRRDERAPRPRRRRRPR